MSGGTKKLTEKQYNYLCKSISKKQISKIISNYKYRYSKKYIEEKYNKPIKEMYDDDGWWQVFFKDGTCGANVFDDSSWIIPAQKKIIKLYKKEVKNA